MPKNLPAIPTQASDLLQGTTTSIRIDEHETPANESVYSDHSEANELDMACISLLNTYVFNGLLSADHIESESIRATERAATALAAVNYDTSVLDDASVRLADRIAFTSRGKRLHHRGLDLTKRLALVTQAILTGRCLTAQYNLRTRELHPYAIVIREPKIYVLAAETQETHRAVNENETPIIKQYLLNRFNKLDLSNTRSNVPDTFSVNNYINAGHMDLKIRTLEEELGNGFELVLKVSARDNDALFRDMQDFSLDINQKASIIPDGQGDYLVTAPGQMPSYALFEWILSRTDRVKVVSPLALKVYLLNCLKATCKQYDEDLVLSEVDADPKKFNKDNREAVDSSHSDFQKETKRRSRYSLSTEDNTLVVTYVLRILDSIRVDDQILHSSELWHLDPLFNGAVRAFIDKNNLSEFKEWLKEQVELSEARTPDHGDPLLVNIQNTAALLELSEVERDVLCLATLVHQNPLLRSALSLMNDSPTEHDAIKMVSVVVCHPEDEVADALKDSSALRKSGFVSRCTISIDSIRDILRMPDTIVTNLFIHHETSLGPLSGLILSSPAPELEADDFEHLAKFVRMALDYLKGATLQKATGCNILLWGPPGTGKTQLARYLANQLSLNSSWEIMSVASNGRILDEFERMASYRYIQRILDKSRESVIIFDEVENIIEPSHYAQSTISKAYFNELLENNPVPSIWISNTVEDVDPAYLRRFDLAIEIPVPESAAKKRVAQRILNDVPINGELLDVFLARREVGPAFLRKIRRVAQLTGADTEQAIGTLATNLLHSEIALSGGTPAILPTSEEGTQAPASLPYDFSLINASEDLGALAGALAPGVNVKFCLYGPPGTGKTAWAKQLANKIGRPALVIQSSDIQDKYVGESEKNIARAFSHAEAENAVLIFDEADTFLSKRSMQRQAHAVSTTNQFLTSLENHKGLVICSTNLLDSMDTAALRRFDFKVKFNYLTAAQANQMLVTVARLLGMELEVGDVIANNCSLSGDTYAPGDFAVVLKKSQVRKSEISLPQLRADIQAEAEVRNIRTAARPIGFVQTASG